MPAGYAKSDGLNTPEAPRLGKCTACATPVIWAQFPDGSKPVEDCPPGKGNVAFQPSLPGLGGRREARIVNVRTAFRLHFPHCPKRNLFAARWAPGRDRRCPCGALLTVPRVALCMDCQRRERERMAKVTADLVAKLGPDGARAQLQALKERWGGRRS